MVFLGVIFYGTLRSASLAWAMGDVGVGLMAWSNMIAILLLATRAIACLKGYEAQRKAGVKEPVYVAKACGVENAAEWKK